MTTPRIYVNEPTIYDCGRGCLTYTTPEGEYDVSAYDLHCPVHGWRWDWPEKWDDEPDFPKTLEACEAKDRAMLARLSAIRSIWSDNHRGNRSGPSPPPLP